MKYVVSFPYESKIGSHGNLYINLRLNEKIPEYNYLSKNPKPQISASNGAPKKLN